MRVGGADTDVAGVAVHHEGGAGCRLHVQQALRVLRADTDIAYRREQVVPLLCGGPAVAGHEQVLAAVELHVAVAVFYTHAEDEAPRSRQVFQDYALLAADTVIDVSIGILGGDVVLPGFGVPALHRVVVDGEGQGCGGIEDPSELHRHGDGVGGGGGLPIGSRVYLGYVDHAGSAVPRRRTAVIENGVNGVLPAFRHLDRIGQGAAVDQVMPESECALPGLHSVDPVGSVSVCFREIVILHNPDYDTAKGLLVLGGDRARYGSAHQCCKLHARLQHHRVRRRHRYRFGVVGALVSRVHEAHLVGAHGDLADDEPAVIAGEADVVGALDDDEGARVPARHPVRKQAVAGNGAGGCQGQVHSRGFQRRHRSQSFCLEPSPGGFDVVGARVKPGEHVDPVVVGDRGVSAAGVRRRHGYGPVE